MANIKKKKLKKRNFTEAQLLKRVQIAFSRKIRNVFVGMGFTYFATNDKHIQVSYKKLEMDALFIYENIIIICALNEKVSSAFDA
ncbi:hypothetical protein [Fusibacter bizertensis]